MDTFEARVLGLASKLDPWAGVTRWKLARDAAFWAAELEAALPMPTAFHAYPALNQWEWVELLDSLRYWCSNYPDSFVYAPLWSTMAKVTKCIGAGGTRHPKPGADPNVVDWQEAFTWDELGWLAIAGTLGVMKRETKP